jgi:hypothetical protein
MSRAIDNVLKPLLDKGGEYEGKIKAIFRPQVQPWHGSSTFTHEAGLAVSFAHYLKSQLHTKVVQLRHFASPQKTSGNSRVRFVELLARAIYAKPDKIFPL